MPPRRIELPGVGAPGVELELAEEGAGGRPLLLLHGFTGAKEDLSEWLAPLAARGWHAVAPDHRGHGASGRPQGDDAYGLATLAGDALAVADALGWHRFVVLGHSMGGMVAQLVALAAPERVEALVLMSTGHGPVGGLTEDQVADVVDLVRRGGIEAYADLLDQLGGGMFDSEASLRLAAERPGWAELGRAKLLACAPEMFCGLVPDMVLGQADRLDGLAALDRPALVLVGQQDGAFLEPSRRLAATLGARLVVLPGAGHGPQFEAPEATWAALTEFLDDLPSEVAP